MKKAVGYEQVYTEMVIQNVGVRELAKRVNMSPETLRKKLRGLSALSIREAFAIRRALGTALPLDTLFSEAMDK